jgi:hypothetical protein
MKTLRTSLAAYCLAAVVVAVSVSAFAPDAFGQEAKPLPEAEGATKPAAAPAPGQADGPIDYSLKKGEKVVREIFLSDGSHIDSERDI